MYMYLSQYNPFKQYKLYIKLSDKVVVLFAGPVSHTSTQCMDFIEIFNMPLDLSTINFAHFSWCSASFVYSCRSILECYNLFSGVKSSTRSFCFISIYQAVRLYETVHISVIWKLSLCKYSSKY